jgi:hypothetical protein
VKLSQGAWINAHTGHWSYIDEHANWAKRPGNLERIGLPVSVWEAIRAIPNDQGENRKTILLAMMVAGGIRMRGHVDFITFEFTVDSDVAIRACREVLTQIAGPLTLCRFNNLATGKTIEANYDSLLSQIEDAGAVDWPTQ